MIVMKIYDEELLPIDKQVDLLEEKCSKNTTADHKGELEQLSRIQHLLNRDYNQARISVFQYVDLSLKLSQQRSLLA